MRLDDAAGRVLGHLLLVDEIAHQLAGRRVGTVNVRLIPRLEHLAPVLRRYVDTRAGRPDFTDEAEDFDPELAEETSRHTARRHAGCGLARAGALERLPAIGSQPLDGPRQVRMSRPRPMQRGSCAQIIEAVVL